MERTLYISITYLLLNSSHALLYPASSSLGLVSSVSVPVLELLPDRRCLIDWCFQMSYDLPSELSSFYNIPIWPGKYSHRNRRRALLNVTSDEESVWARAHKYNSTYDNDVHPSDLSAAELYKGVADLLISYGLHETCVLRSVCELARHPFDEDDRNIITDVITFLLTPSMHNGFTSSELAQRMQYEDAERSGFLGEDCESLYPQCHVDVLGVVTHIVIPNL